MKGVLSILSVALGRPLRHGCWTTEPDWGRHGYGMGTGEERWLPKPDYYLDESDPDAQGATMEGLVEASEEDYGKLIGANAESLGLREEGHRKRSA